MSLRSFGEPLAKLRRVPINECGEPLVNPLELSGRLHMAPKHERFGDIPRSPYVRRRVAEMLAAAAEALPSGLAIHIVQGWRSLAQQRHFYDEVRKELQEQHPSWDKAALHRALHRLVAPPDDPAPPPHITGGAVDVYLVNRDGNRLDVTSPYEWNAHSAPTSFAGISDDAKENRRLMREVFESAGLTNYAGEWWHWSFGDQGWALRTGAAFAVYGPVDGPSGWVD